MAIGDEKDMDDATVVASPSFDAMLEARGESMGEAAEDGRSYDEQAAAREAAKSHEAAAFAATVSGPSYDARLEAMGLPLPADIEPGAEAWSEAKPGADPGVPKTMVLSPQQWGLPAQPPPGQPAPPAAQPSYPQPSHAQPSHAQPSYPQPSHAQPSYAQPSYGQPSYGQPPFGQAAYPPAPHPVPVATAQPKAAGKSGLTLFLISAAVTLVVFGSCAVGVIVYLVLRG